MEKIWAPWRAKYIQSKKQKGCVFCQCLKKECKNYLIFKTKYSLSLLNIFPYNNGHAMVSPRRHVKELAQLKEAEVLDLFKSLSLTKKLLSRVLNPDGYNIGINESEAAGAGIAGHLHIHIVPRWVGDTNFMPVLSGTKVISQSLDDLYKLLKKANVRF